MEDRLSMTITKKPNRTVLMDIVLEKVAEIHDKEQVKIWADSVRACNNKNNELLLRRMELTKNTKFFR